MSLLILSVHAAHRLFTLLMPRRVSTFFEKRLCSLAAQQKFVPVVPLWCCSTRKIWPRCDIATYLSHMYA